MFKSILNSMATMWVLLVCGVLLVVLFEAIYRIEVLALFWRMLHGMSVLVIVLTVPVLVLVFLINAASAGASTAASTTLRRLRTTLVVAAVPYLMANLIYFYLWLGYQDPYRFPLGIYRHSTVSVWATVIMSLALLFAPFVKKPVRRQFLAVVFALGGVAYCVDAWHWNAQITSQNRLQAERHLYPHD